nr:atherin-like [Macaca fascicularis]XP_045250601.1 atherin-like [Macaca fascicularis]XP_045250602.1 atherin-like [Macaca fascicularis]XP_045250603.1 atherin-like [Macaca fascicularis]
MWPGRWECGHPSSCRRHQGWGATYRAAAARALHPGPAELLQREPSIRALPSGPCGAAAARALHPGPAELLQREPSIRALRELLQREPSIRALRSCCSASPPSGPCGAAAARARHPGPSIRALRSCCSASPPSGPFHPGPAELLQREPSIRVPPQPLSPLSAWNSDTTLGEEL